MIQFFVSSTFRDMHYERDIINSVILPQLKHIANDCGENISLTDLRWGIDTQNIDPVEGMRKILSVCMQEIEFSFPHLIIMIGDRYGSVPDSRMIDDFLRSPGGSDFKYEETVGKSITELEIIHAIEHLASSYEGNLSDCFTIVLRDPIDHTFMSNDSKSHYLAASSEESIQVKKLKERLESLYPSAAIHYTAKWDSESDCPVGFEEFIRKLVQRLSMCLKQFLPSHPLSAEELHWKNDEARRKYAEKRVILLNEEQNYYTSFLNTINHQKSDHPHVLLLYGEHGSGTSMHAFAVNQLARKFGFKTVQITCSPLYDNSVVSAMLKHMIWRLEFEMNFDHKDMKICSLHECRNRLTMLIQKINAPVLFILDGIDSYVPEIRKQILYALPSTDQCGYLFTAVNSTAVAHLLPERFEFSCYGINHNKVSYFKTMIKKEAEITRKEYSPRLIDSVSLLSVSRSPLYMRLLLSYISLMMNAQSYFNIEKRADSSNKAEQLYTYIHEKLQTLPGNEKDLAWVLLVKAGTSMNENTVNFIAQLFTLIPAGLRQEDILGIYHRAYPEASISMLDITILINQCDILFQRTDDGRVSFAHDLIQHNSLDSHFIYRAICAYLCDLSDDDPIKLREYIPVCICVERYDLAANYLIEIRKDIDREEVKSFLLTNEPKRINNSKQDLIISSWSLASRAYPEISQRNPVDMVKCIFDACKFKEDRTRIRALLNTFLFTYDRFFSHLSTKSQNQIMDRLREFCMDYLYTDDPIPDGFSSEQMKKLFELRTVYICFEQCGIRADSYAKRKAMYNAFYQICSNVYQQLTPNHPFYLTVLKDLNSACDKMASLKGYPLKNRLEYLQYADELLRKYEHLNINCDIKREQILNHFSQAVYIVEAAWSKKQIGWPENISESFQDFVTDAAKELISYFRLQPSSEFSYNKIVTAYQILSEYERCRTQKNPQKEVELCKAMISAAKDWYRFNGDVYAADRIRNGYLRLALADASSEPAMALKNIEKSYEQIERMREAVPMERLTPIVTMTLKEFLKILMKCLAPVKDDPVYTARLCCIFLDKVFEHDNYELFLADLYTSDTKNSLKSTYEELLKISLNTVFKCQKYCLNLAKAEEYEPAIELCNLLSHLTDLITPSYGHIAAYWDALKDIDNFQSIVWHNYRAFIFKHEQNWSCETDKAEYFLNKSYYDSIISHYLSGEEFSLLSDNTKRNQYVNYSNSLLMSASYFWNTKNVSPEEHNKRNCFFRKLLKSRQYQLPGQGTMYFTTFVYEYRDHESLLNPIGLYLCDHLDDPEILSLLENSDLFETLALEYAYRNCRKTDAYKIIYNGYMHFLELPMLMIIFRYDRSEYNKIFFELRASCVRRLYNNTIAFMDILGPYTELFLRDIHDAEHKFINVYHCLSTAVFDYAIEINEKINDEQVASVRFTSNDGKEWRLDFCGILNYEEAAKKNRAEYHDLESDKFSQKIRSIKKNLKKSIRVINKKAPRKPYSPSDQDYLIARCLLLEQQWFQNSKHTHDDKYIWANLITQRYDQ